MTNREGFESRIHEIGREIFELADAARLTPWQKAWWLEQGTRLLDHDDLLKARAFQFVDCMPALRDDASISRHLAEYFSDVPLNLSRVFDVVVGPGPLRGLREKLVSRAAVRGATEMAGRFITGHDGPKGRAIFI